jgi:hypothetical protein
MNPSPMKLYQVHAYAEPFDATPEAIYLVAASDEDEAGELVKRHPAAAHYRRQSVIPHDVAEIIEFKPVKQT